MGKITKKNKVRIIVAFLVIAALFVVLTFRIAWIQVVKADEYTQKAINQQTSDLPLEANRGDILDKNGISMATSATCYSVWIRPAQLQENYKESKLKEYSESLAAIIDVDADTIYEDMTSDKTLIQIAKYLTKEKIDEVKALNITGVETAEGTKRYYPLGTEAAQLLGSVNDDNEGRSGIELQFNSYLSGVSGRWIKDTDINGNTLSYGSKKFYAAQDGYNVNLTIDSVLQHYAEEAIEYGMDLTGASRIMFLAMNPKTGDVLAMATTPSFDPNEPLEPASDTEKAKYNALSSTEKSAYLNNMWKNPLVSDLYEPGSTFKLITVSGALEEGTTSMDRTYTDTGSITVDGVTLKCWGSAHGTQTLKEAVGNSCNPVLVQIGLEQGRDRFYKYLELFGITTTTGIDLPAEASAIIKDKDSMSRVDYATMAYGQGIAVTPIQLLTAINAIGNGGVIMKPRIVSSLTDENGKVVKEYKTQSVRQVISTETADEMKEIMEYVVSSGGAQTAKISGYRIGGKTGTAYKASGGTYTNQVYASFVGMAPMDDPQISILVIVDSPTKTFYGSESAAPIAKKFFESALPYLDISPSSSKSDSSTTKANITVPDYTGKKSDEAIKSIQSLGLSYKIMPSSTQGTFDVVDQYPKAGKQVSKGTTVYLYSE